MLALKSHSKRQGISSLILSVSLVGITSLRKYQTNHRKFILFDEYSDNYNTADIVVILYLCDVVIGIFNAIPR